LLKSLLNSDPFWLAFTSALPDASAGLSFPGCSDPFQSYCSGKHFFTTSFPNNGGTWQSSCLPVVQWVWRSVSQLVWIFTSGTANLDCPWNQLFFLRLLIPEERFTLAYHVFTHHYVSHLLKFESLAGLVSEGGEQGRAVSCLLAFPAFTSLIQELQMFVRLTRSINVQKH
jgi:hypothetical protein